MISLTKNVIMLKIISIKKQIPKNIYISTYHVLCSSIKNKLLRFENYKLKSTQPTLDGFIHRPPKASEYNQKTNLKRAAEDTAASAAKKPKPEGRPSTLLHNSPLTRRIKKTAELTIDKVTQNLSLLLRKTSVNNPFPYTKTFSEDMKTLLSITQTPRATKKHQNIQVTNIELVNLILPELIDLSECLCNLANEILNKKISMANDLYDNAIHIISFVIKVKSAAREEFDESHILKMFNTLVDSNFKLAQRYLHTIDTEQGFEKAYNLGRIGKKFSRNVLDTIHQHTKNKRSEIYQVQTWAIYQRLIVEQSDLLVKHKIPHSSDRAMSLCWQGLLDYDKYGIELPEYKFALLEKLLHTQKSAIGAKDPSAPSNYMTLFSEIVKGDFLSDSQGYALIPLRDKHMTQETVQALRLHTLPVTLDKTRDERAQVFEMIKDPVESVKKAI